MLTAIVAMDPNRLIGKNGTLPWHLPADLAFFKKTTSGHPVLMGRKTFDSIGRPLPKRRNIILTRDQNWQHTGVEVVYNLDQISHLDEEVFVIGGAEIYAALGDRIDAWLVSHVKTCHDGDTYLAPFECNFPVIETIEEHPEFVIRRYLRH